jgi:hypothetical protein
MSEFVYVCYVKSCLLGGEHIEAGRIVLHSYASVIIAVIINHNLTDFKLSRRSVDNVDCAVVC